MYEERDQDASLLLLYSIRSQGGSYTGQKVNRIHRVEQRIQEAKWIGYVTSSSLVKSIALSNVSCQTCLHNHTKDLKVFPGIFGSCFGWLPIDNECVELLHLQSIGVLVGLSNQRFPERSFGQFFTNMHIGWQSLDVRRVKANLYGLLLAKDLN